MIMADDQQNSSDPLDKIDGGGFKKTNQKQREAAENWHEQIEESNEAVKKRQK